MACFMYFPELNDVINEVIFGFENDFLLPLINLSFLKKSISSLIDFKSELIKVILCLILIN
jgi:hypothetical protein